MSQKRCTLKSCEGNHDPIELLDNSPVILGRGPLTKIKDSRCSRSQVLLVADYASNVVNVTQLGRNPCGLNGVQMMKDDVMEGRHGDIVDILFGQFRHVLDFSPPPTNEPNAAPSKPSALAKPPAPAKHAAPAKPSSSAKPTPSEKSVSTAKPTSTTDSEKPVNDVSDSDDDQEPLSKKMKTTPIGSYRVTANLWDSVDNGQLLIYTPPGVVNRDRIASFDLDHTIITTLSGATFPKSPDDWQIMYPEVVTKLQKHYSNNYKLVIFTNQGGIKMYTNTDLFQNKVEAVVAKLKLPIQVFVAAGPSKYRKPCIFMWNAMVARNGGKVDMLGSFYCGDAAGRLASLEQKTKSDFSQSDLLFARNIGINFVTPEEHFLGKRTSAPRVSAFSPQSISPELPLCDPEWGQIHSTRPELVLLVGCPGSGKTHFAKTHLIPAGYVHINRDSLGSMTKCLQAVENAIKSKLHVVVDNTNPTVEARDKFIKLAKRFGLPVRAFVMNTSIAHAKHNLKFRQITDPSREEINESLVHGFFRSYEEPSSSEGLTEIIKINFWLTLKDPELEKVYNMYLTDK